MSLTTINRDNIFQNEAIGKVRKAQEDSHDIATQTPNGDVFVVCDGMGGHVGGKQASSIAVRSIIDYLKKAKNLQPKEALKNALQFANIQILGYANEHPELKGMGTTACIVLLQDSEAYIAHIGDSRIYLYLGNEKQLHRITKDHSYVQSLVDAGQITDEEAECHPNKNRILKALGIKSNIDPSFEQVEPKNGDIFLICSDGLNGMIPDNRIKNILMHNSMSLQDKGETLINQALEAGGTDNITVELVQITNSPHKKTTFRSYNPKNTDQVSVCKWNFIKISFISIIIVMLSCILFHIISLKKLEGHKHQIHVETQKLNDQILKVQEEIDCQSKKKKLLTIEHQRRISQIDSNQSIHELELIFEKQQNNIDDNIKTAEKRIKIYREKKDSLLNIKERLQKELNDQRWIIKE